MQINGSYCLTAVINYINYLSNSITTVKTGKYYFIITAIIQYFRPGKQEYLNYQITH